MAMQPVTRQPIATKPGQPGGVPVGPGTPDPVMGGIPAPPAPGHTAVTPPGTPGAAPVAPPPPHVPGISASQGSEITPVTPTGPSGTPPGSTTPPSTPFTGYYQPNTSLAGQVGKSAQVIDSMTGKTIQGTVQAFRSPSGGTYYGVVDPATGNIVDNFGQVLQGTANTASNPGVPGVNGVVSAAPGLTAGLNIAGGSNAAAYAPGSDNGQSSPIGFDASGAPVPGTIPTGGLTAVGGQSTVGMAPGQASQLFDQAISFGNSSIGQSDLAQSNAVESAFNPGFNPNAAGATQIGSQNPQTLAPASVPGTTTGSTSASLASPGAVVSPPATQTGSRCNTGAPSATTASVPGTSAALATPTAPAAGSYATTQGVVPGSTSDLTSQLITPGATTDPLTLAQQYMSAWDQANNPQFQANLRDANRYAASSGAIGSGALASSLGDVVQNEAILRNAAEQNFLTNAETQSVSAAFQKVQILLQEQQFQAQQQATAFGQAATTEQLGMQNNPAEMQLALAQIFQGLSSSAQQALAQSIYSSQQGQINPQLLAILQQYMGK